MSLLADGGHRLADGAHRLTDNPLIRPLADSFRIHLRRPVIPLFTLGATCFIFLIRGWMGNGFDTRMLASTFAVPPMDSFGDFGFSGAGLLSLALAPARLAVVWLAMTWLISEKRKVSIRPARKKIAEFALINVLALVSVLVVLVCLALVMESIGPSLARVAAPEAAATADLPEAPKRNGPLQAETGLNVAPYEKAVAGVVFYIVGLPVFLLLAVIFTSWIGRCVAGERSSPTLKRGAIWMSAILSGWLWWAAVGPSPLVGAPDGADYAAGFFAVFLQSVFYGAAVIAAASPAPSRGSSSQPLPDNFSILKREKPPPSIFKRLQSSVSPDYPKVTGPTGPKAERTGPMKPVRMRPPAPESRVPVARKPC